MDLLIIFNLSKCAITCRSLASSHRFETSSPCMKCLPSGQCDQKDVEKVVAATLDRTLSWNAKTSIKPRFLRELVIFSFNLSVKRLARPTTLCRGEL